MDIASAGSSRTTNAAGPAQAVNSPAQDDNQEANQAQVRSSLFKTIPGFFLKPFSSSKHKRTIQTHPKSVYDLPAQPLRAEDFKKIREAIAIVDANSPLPPRDYQIKRKRDLVSPVADTTSKKSVKFATLDSYFI
jgi:hypothetical protein